MPARGFALRSRAAPGHHRPALRPDREELAGLGQAHGGQNSRTGRVPGNKGLELNHRGHNRWQVPQRERRKASAPQSVAPHAAVAPATTAARGDGALPQRIAGGDACGRPADIAGCAFRRSAPSRWGGANTGFDSFAFLRGRDRNSGAARRESAVARSVIPGRAAGANPESIATGQAASHQLFGPATRVLWNSG